MVQEPITYFKVELLYVETLKIKKPAIEELFTCATQCTHSSIPKTIIF